MLPLLVADHSWLLIGQERPDMGIALLVVFISRARQDRPGQYQASQGRGEGGPEKHQNKTPVRESEEGVGVVPSGAAPEGAMHYPSIVILQLIPDVLVHVKIPCFWAMRVGIVLQWALGGLVAVALTADHAPNRGIEGSIKSNAPCLLDSGQTDV